MHSPIAALKLLQQLLKRIARQDKAFDKYKISFLKKLQNSNSDTITESLYDECITQISELPAPIEDTLSEGRLIVSQSQLQLQKLSHLSDQINQKIEASKSISQPYSIIEHHSELSNIIKIYQRVVIELNKNKDASPCATNAPLVNNICDELQQVILNLDVGTAYIKKLEAIRKKISNENNANALPLYCLEIISIIIDSTREERRSSRHFLYTLNDSLTQFYLNFSKNIKLAESAFEKQDKCVKSIQKQSIALKKETQNSVDLISLQKHIFDYVENVEDMIQSREDEKEQQVRQQFQGMARQIKELQNETNNYQKTLKQQSKQLHIDFLTKIPNRAAWSERLQVEFTRYQRYQHPLNIAVIDIDKFKVINDTFGHLAGDKVLNVIAQTLQKSIRNTDFIARYGGEEFAILLPEITTEQSQLTLEKLCQTIKKIPFKFKKQSISITISVGCTSFCQTDDLDSAFERADQALYHAKGNGRDQVVCFEKE
ncbi:GGDEF domain-containing protein [Psychromonas sp. Urea-02u-13]|uniref:GGDEF domain-containing protein n=1 Tax=Psychromonas sp. Urea-02u-13 TaxID=2058326 RepID=UPI000C33A10A|nr:GGDEF domain-containing protein [Psychromonas sp. Urea-02u-13]PKG38513.1 GGDEF domain-containing protein [Psychromonas sp. Urea-02u-13]